MSRWRALSLAALAALAIGSATGSRAAPAVAGEPVVHDGDDWSLPAWVTPSARSGFYSEFDEPALHVDVRAVDQTWKQLAPAPDAPLVTSTTGSAQGMSFGSLDDQLAKPGPFWMRIFASGEQWAPEWVLTRCGTAGKPLVTYGPDYDGQRHLPMWNECVWGELMDVYRELFVARNLRADERLQFVYIPGAFTWAEFDYETMRAAHDAGDLDFATFHRWYQRMIRDFSEIFGEYRYKLVFTGEDYPFGPFGAQDDLLAKEMVDAGFGIRNGITEEFNYHLNEAPAYGSRIMPDGHLAVDESTRDGKRVFATENECFNACGFVTTDPYYAVRQANLKALQLRLNWIYVVPKPSYLKPYRELWDWVRMSLGKRAADSPDAWAALRDAEDRYWLEDDAVEWKTKPFVRNLERWLVQVDRPGCVAHRSEADIQAKVFNEENGTAYEGLRTDLAAGDTGLCFTLDSEFLGATRGDVEVKVTYQDAGTGTIGVSWGEQRAALQRTGDGAWKTATFVLRPTGSDLRVEVTGQDTTVRMVRVVRTSAPVTS